MGDGTESQDSTVYYIICGTSLFNILGCIFSFTIISLVRQYESEYSSRLLKAIVFASFWLSLSMLVTPYGYDSDDTTLPSTGQCEWQSFLFVLFSEARWWFTVILFSSECRKVILDSWPTKNFLAHNMLAWGYSILLAAVGWILTAVLSDDIYSWQWSGRCGIKSDTDNGALFLLSKLVIDLLLMIWILKYYCMARFILSNREQMRSHSPDTGVVGMWMEDYYERVMSRQSVYFHIGGWGCFVKAIVMIWELLLVLSQFDILDVDSGKISVTMEVSATCIYGFFIFLVLLVINWGVVKRFLSGLYCCCCCGSDVRTEEGFCMLEGDVAMQNLADPYGIWEQESHQWGRFKHTTPSPRNTHEPLPPSPTSPTSDLKSPSSTKVSVNPLAELDVE